MTRKPSTAEHPDEQPLRKAMQRWWGYEDFRPLQQEAMTAGLQGRDSLVVMPTGGGKSLCYQVPAVCRDGMAVVISPLISLMKDQVDALTECGISAACINSSLSPEERRDVAERIRRRELRLLFAAPERLVRQHTIQFLREFPLSLFAIDEAHCVSQWGHDFRPEYRQLKAMLDCFPDVSRHAFTATATESVRADIAEQLGLRDPQILVGSFDRPNLTYRVLRRADLIPQLLSVISKHPEESGIIYCISRRAAEQTSRDLNAAGYSALPYHAGLSPEERRNHQDAFIADRVRIIVATVAFGMGIDKSNVRFVIHAGLPRSIESYQQESGRAGRDGLEADCTLFWSQKDVDTWKYLIDQSETGENRQSSLAGLTEMEKFCASPVCRHRMLVSHFGQRYEKNNCGACDVCCGESEAVADALVISQKILSGVIRQEQRYGAEYTVQVLRGSRSRKVLSNRHERLSTYGLLSHEPAAVVREWVDQLVAQGFLDREPEHSVLSVTEAGRSVLRGVTTPRLTRPTTQRQPLAPSADRWEGVDRELFSRLRTLRTSLAAERGVAAYMILSDVSLRELSRVRPDSEESLLQVHGIGQRKASQFGSRLLEVIRSHGNDGDPHDAQVTAVAGQEASASEPMSTSRRERFTDLIDEGLSIDEIALQLNAGADTVVKYVTDIIRTRQIDDPHRWVNPETVARITEAIDRVGRERLKPIFEELEESVSYEDLRIVVTCLEVSEAIAGRAGPRHRR